MENVNQEQQELMYKVNMFEQQMNQLQQQLQAVEQGIGGMTGLHLSLNDLKSAEGKEILAPIGKGMFAKAKIISEDLIVDIGNKTLINKSIEDSQKIIVNQVKKLEDVKKKLNSSLDNLNSEMTKLFIGLKEKEDAKMKENKK